MEAAAVIPSPMSIERTITTIPAGTGDHVFLRQGAKIKVINPSGHQVVDLWALPIGALPAWMSMAQTRSKLRRLIPIVNDTFIDTHRSPILKLVEDISPRIHDMIFPACDAWRYAEAGVPEHGSCAANLRAELSSIIKSPPDAMALDGFQTSALRELESNIKDWGWTPEPLNLFMNVPAGPMSNGGKGELQVAKPVCKGGDYVVLKAEVDCIVIMSACPNDLLATNGGKPGDALYQVLR